MKPNDLPLSAATESGLTIAGRTYRSRLLVGTGKFRDMEETRLAIMASGAEIVTLAIRRVNIGQDKNAQSAGGRTAIQVHAAAQHGRLLQGRGSGVHLEARA